MENLTHKLGSYYITEDNKLHVIYDEHPEEILILPYDFDNYEQAIHFMETNNPGFRRVHKDPQ